MTDNDKTIAEGAIQWILNMVEAGLITHVRQKWSKWDKKTANWEPISYQDIAQMYSDYLDGKRERM